MDLRTNIHLDPDPGPWFIALTLPGQDGKACDALRNRRYQVYRPIMPALVRQRCGHSYQTVRSMFPGYVLIRDMFGQGWDWLRTVGAVRKLWVRNGSLATLDDEDILEVKKMEKHEWSKGVDVGETHDFKLGEVRVVQRGPFIGQFVTIEDLDDEQRIGVLIDLLGRKTRTYLPPAYLISA
jgi:transcriptional antiterminator RfaH